MTEEYIRKSDVVKVLTNNRVHFGDIVKITSEINSLDTFEFNNQESVLDEIRTEIEQEYTTFRNKSDRWSERACGLGMALEIIDKYRKGENATIDMRSESLGGFSYMMDCLEKNDIPEDYKKILRMWDRRSRGYRRQEPCENAVSREAVLDKIKSEIEQEYNRLSSTRADETLELGECLGLKLSLKIIDKCRKGETE